MHKLNYIVVLVFLMVPFVGGAIQNGDFALGQTGWTVYEEGVNCSATFYPSPDPDPHCRVLGYRLETCEIYQEETGFDGGETWRATFDIREVSKGGGGYTTIGWTNASGDFGSHYQELSSGVSGVFSVDCDDASYKWVTVHAQGSMILNAIIDVDEISTQDISGPTPTPTPPPTPSPTPRPGGSTVDDFDFEASTEGWSESTSTGFSLPTTSHSSGAIGLESADDAVNRFGFWTSPGGGVTYEATKVYVARYFVRTDQTSPGKVPSMRLRWISQGLEANAGNAMTSEGSFSYTPTTAAKEYQSYFYPPSTSAMNVAFDVLDFGPTEGGTLYLDQAIVEKFDRPGNIGTGTAVKTYDIAPDFSTWTFNPNFGGGFGNVTSANWGTGSLSLSSTTANSANAGFFSGPSPSSECTYDAADPHLYRAAFTLSIGNDADRTSMCGIRMRVQNEDNQMTQTMEVTSLNGGVAMPYEAGTDYELYWATPDLPGSPGTGEDGFFAALDILDFNGSEGGQVNLESIVIEYF